MGEFAISAGHDFEAMIVYIQMPGDAGPGHCYLGSLHTGVPTVEAPCEAFFALAGRFMNAGSGLVSTVIHVELPFPLSVWSAPRNARSDLGAAIYSFADHNSLRLSEIIVRQGDRQKNRAEQPGPWRG